MHWEYFKGNRTEDWPKGAVYLDTGYTDPKYFTIYLQVGTSMVKIDSEEAQQILCAVQRAEERLKELRNG